MNDKDIIELARREAERTGDERVKVTVRNVREPWSNTAMIIVGAILLLALSMCGA